MNADFKKEKGEKRNLKFQDFRFEMRIRRLDYRQSGDKSRISQRDAYGKVRNDKRRDGRQIGMRGLMFGAVLFPLAFFAVSAGPDGIEPGGNGGNEFLIGSNKTGFKVPASRTLGAHAGASEIGTATISKLTVDNHGLEVDARADDPFQAAQQSGITVEITLENRAGLLGVQKTNFDALLGQVREYIEKRDHAATLGNVEVLQIGSG